MRMWLSGQRGETGTFKDRTINTVPSPQGLRRGEVMGATVSGGRGHSQPTRVRARRPEELGCDCLEGYGGCEAGERRRGAGRQGTEARTVRAHPALKLGGRLFAENSGAERSR